MTALTPEQAKLYQRVRELGARVDGFRQALADQRPTDEQIAECETEMAAIQADLQAMRK